MSDGVNFEVIHWIFEIFQSSNLPNCATATVTSLPLRLFGGPFFNRSPPTSNQNQIRLNYFDWLESTQLFPPPPTPSSADKRRQTVETTDSEDKLASQVVILTLEVFWLLGFASSTQL